MPNKYEILNRKLLVNNILQCVLVWLQGYIWSNDTNTDKLGKEILDLLKQYENEKDKYLTESN